MIAFFMLHSMIIFEYNDAGLKCKIAKLFAKHFKVQDQIDLLSKQYFPVAVGTPNRLSKLIELGALSLSRVKVINEVMFIIIEAVYIHPRSAF